MGNDELEVPTEGGARQYGGSGGLSRSSSNRNIPSIVASSSSSMLMQKRIDDVESSFKHLDRLTDEIDYDIETFESVTKRLRNGFDNIQLDIQTIRDEMLDLFDRLDAMEVGIKSRIKGNIPKTDALGRRSLMGSRQMIYGSSSSDLRGSNYALNKGSRSYSSASTPPSKKDKASLKPSNFTPTYSPASSARMSPAPSAENIQGDDGIAFGSNRDEYRDEEEFYAKEQPTGKKWKDDDQRDLYEDERYDDGERLEKERFDKERSDRYVEEDRYEDKPYKDDRYEDDRYDDERYDDERYDDERYDDDRYDDEQYEREVKKSRNVKDEDYEDDVLEDGPAKINGNRYSGDQEEDYYEEDRSNGLKERKHIADENANDRYEVDAAVQNGKHYDEKWSEEEEIKRKPLKKSGKYIDDHDDRYDNDRYEDDRYDDDRYEDDRYEDDRYDRRHKDDRYDEDSYEDDRYEEENRTGGRYDEDGRYEDE